MTIQTIPVPRALLPEMWPHVLPLVERALAENRGESEADDIAALIDRGMAQLWLVTGRSKLMGAVVTEIIRWPRQTEANVLLVAGEGFEDWGPSTMNALKEWARQSGCEVLRGRGRKGWARLGAKLGMEQAYVVMETSL